MQRMEADVFRPGRNCKAGILTARDETTQALEQGSAGMEQGEWTGTIGLNGAGYSTTDKILSAVRMPDKGKPWRKKGIPGGKRESLAEKGNPWMNREGKVKAVGVFFGQRMQPGRGMTSMT